MQPKTLTIRLPQDDLFQKEFNFCSNYLEQKTASKTFIEAIHSLTSFINIVIEQNKEVEALEIENLELKNIIENARNSAIEFIKDIHK